MLTQIKISNLITIWDLTLDLKPGMTVMTGETGAGKSILIDAIELALGGRASPEMIQQGQEKAEIHLCFDITQHRLVEQWLKKHEFYDEGGVCIIRRIIYKDGRSRSFINGQPSTLQPVRELAEHLIQIHGQHEHQSLLKAETQRHLLDDFAGHQALVKTVEHTAEEWKKLQNALRILEEKQKTDLIQSQYLRYQLEDLNTLRLIPDEFQQLDLEHKQLAHGESLLQNIHYTLQALSDREDENAGHFLNDALQALENIREVDPKIHTWITSLQNALIHIQDTSSELRHYLNHIELDPERLHQVNVRIGILFDAARKYKIAPHELYDFQQTLLSKIKSWTACDISITEIKKQIQCIEQTYLENAKKLTLSRSHFAQTLAQHIQNILHTLSMPEAKFQVQLEPLTDFFSPQGQEKINFLIKTNEGQLLLPLAKIVSGGELSRISLAIHMATANQHTTPSLIFDEVDVGIGGRTAEQVGKLLRQLGGSHQLLCITHQPQVAAQGHYHLLVSKQHTASSTQTKISFLTKSERTDEIARMLGGIHITQKTLDHAREMVVQAQ